MQMNSGRCQEEIKTGHRRFRKTPGRRNCEAHSCDLQHRFADRRVKASWPGQLLPSVDRPGLVPREADVKFDHTKSHLEVTKCALAVIAVPGRCPRSQVSLPRHLVRATR